MFLCTPAALAQNPDTMDPDKSTAKAKQLLNQAIEALGGSAYKNSLESECEGRVAQLDRNGSLEGFNNIRSYWHYPDKNRTEYEVKSTKGGFFAVLVGSLPIKGGTFIQLFNGDKGWTMDKGGVNEADATVVAQFQDVMKRQIHNLLLDRVNEEGVFLRYAGIGVADLRQVEWVEISDRDGRSVRLALEHGTHLPLRTIVSTPNEEMRDTDEDVTIYSNYKELEGVQTPLQVTREHNGRRTHQIFYNSCRHNPSLPADFFTETGLQKRFKETGGKYTPQK
ncbi:MAG: hypothetical protein WBL63_25100 [Candidatus Acidiferrum sp.]